MQTIASRDIPHEQEVSSIGRAAAGEGGQVPMILPI